LGLFFPIYGKILKCSKPPTRYHITLLYTLQSYYTGSCRELNFRDANKIETKYTLIAER
jgi:hypothetical protein